MNFQPLQAVRSKFCAIFKHEQRAHVILSRVVKSRDGHQPAAKIDVVIQPEWLAGILPGYVHIVFKYLSLIVAPFQYPTLKVFNDGKHLLVDTKRHALKCANSVGVTEIATGKRRLNRFFLLFTRRAREGYVRTIAAIHFE